MILFDRTFIQKVSIVIIVDTLVKILGFIILPIYLSQMPKDEFGEFTFMFTTAITLSTLMTLNLYVIVIRDLSKSNNLKKNSEYYSTLSIFIIFFNSFLLLLGFLLELKYSIISSFFGINIYNIEKIACFLLIIFFNVLSLFQYSLILTRKKSFEICLYLILKFLFANFVSLILLFQYNYYDTVSLRLFGILIGETILFVFLQILISKKYFLFIFNKKYLKNKIIIVYPLIIATLLSLIMITIDKKLIQFYFGNEYLAEYNLVYILLLPLSMVIASFQSIWNPILFKIDKFNKAFVQTKSILIYIFIFLIFLSLAVYLFIKILLDFDIINKEYNNILNLYLTMIFGMIFGVLINFIDGLNLYLNKTHYKLVVMSVIVIIFSILNFILVPLKGYYGVAFSLFSANLIGFIFGYYLLSKNLKNEK